MNWYLCNASNCCICFAARIKRKRLTIKLVMTPLLFVEPQNEQSHVAHSRIIYICNASSCWSFLTRTPNPHFYLLQKKKNWRRQLILQAMNITFSIHLTEEYSSRKKSKPRTKYWRSHAPLDFQNLYTSRSDSAAEETKFDHLNPISLMCTLNRTKFSPEANKTFWTIRYEQISLKKPSQNDTACS